jgi:hypothetical protein
MRILILSAAGCMAAVGVALAQVEASSSTYFLDVDPARYSGPAAQRLMVTLDDQPRHVSLGAQDEICVQLKRAEEGSQVISARVRVLRPEPQPSTVVRVVGPDISPGTYRSTPWGMLLRAVPRGTTNEFATPVGIADAPVCDL